MVQPRARHVAEGARHVVVSAGREQALRIFCAQQQLMTRGVLECANRHIRIAKAVVTLISPLEPADPSPRRTSWVVLPELKASGGIIQVELCRRVSSMLTWPLSDPARNMLPCQDHDMLLPQERLQHRASDAGSDGTRAYVSHNRHAGAGIYLRMPASY